MFVLIENLVVDDIDMEDIFVEVPDDLISRDQILEKDSEYVHALIAEDFGEQFTDATYSVSVPPIKDVNKWMDISKTDF